MRVEPVEKCLLCCGTGAILYESVRDRLFNAPGEYNFYRCRNCSFVWLSPRPVREDIQECYRDYYTHQFSQSDRQAVFRQLRDNLRLWILHAHYGLPLKDNNKFKFFAGWFLGEIPSLLRKAAYCENVFPPWSGEGRLLDVGCGSGYFLAFMRRMGWKVQGVEIDPEAARVAREVHKIPVFTGDLDKADFPAGSFDAITISHVIEHAYNPPDLLKECYRILACGGCLRVATPNIQGLGHKIFKKDWLALDPPRHLYLWGPETLKEALKRAGFRLLRCETSGLAAASTFMASRQIKIKGRYNFDESISLDARMFGWFEMILNFFIRSSGEEVRLLACKEK